MGTRLPGEPTLFETAKRALTVQTGLHWKDVESSLLHAPVSIVIGSTTVYVVEVKVKHTEDQLRKAALNRTSIVGAHVGISQWKSLLEVVQREWRQLEVQMVERLCKRRIDQEKEKCKINNKETVMQLKSIKDRKDAHGLDQDLNLIKRKRDEAETKEGHNTKQGRGHTAGGPGGEKSLQTSYEGEAPEVCMCNSGRPQKIQMQGEHVGGGSLEGLAILREVQTQSGICTEDSSQGNDVEDTTRKLARHQHQRDRRDGDENAHEKIC